MALRAPDPPSLQPASAIRHRGRRRPSHEALLADIAHLLASEESQDRILDSVADALGQIVPYDALTVYTADAPRRVLHPVVVRDTDAALIRAMGGLPYGRGITGVVAETGVPELANDAHRDERSQLVPGTEDEPESMLAIPLVARGTLTGVLCLSRLGEEHHFARREFALAIRFGELAALAIDNATIRARLETEVASDHLTGLYNHRFFHERLAEEVARANRRRAPVSLIVFDLDDFKWINDTWGHSAGDRVLQQATSLAREACRDEDVLCRIGGEEFAVILPGQDADEACGLAERLRGAVAEYPFSANIRVTVSAGVAEAPRHATSARALFDRADGALYMAKTAGKNRVEIHETDRPPPPPDPAGALAELRSAAQLRMLHSVASKLNRLNDVEEIGDAIAVELKGLIDYHNCRVYVLATDESVLLPVTFRGVLTEYEGETFDALVTKVGEGVTGRVAETGETIYLPNAEECEFAVQIPGTSDVLESMLAVPMRSGDRTVGVIVLSKLGIDQFDSADVRLLEVLASNAAIALENARLLEAERLAAGAIEEAYLSTVEALANALEAQDEYTANHARSLATMAMSVGMDLRMAPERLKQLELAALFHDIGKIGVRSEVIRKPGPLSPDERSEMDRHPEIGADILAPVPFLQSIRPIVRACHERWDGKGYPDRLAGEEIPLEARIVFVCDAFHAMTSDRPYRAALPVSEALDRLSASAGEQFDAEIVERFVRLVRTGRVQLEHAADHA